MTTRNSINNLIPGSVDGVNRQLIASDGTTVKMDWHDSNDILFKSTSGTEFEIAQGAGSVVNYLQVVGAPTGNEPLINAVGGDTNVGLTLQTKGIGSMDFTSTVGGTSMLNLINQASAVNNLSIAVATAGNPPVISVGGTDTDVSMKLTAKGAGYIQSSNPIAAYDGFRVQEITNGRAGVVTLSSGIGVVGNTSITANTRIKYSAQDTNTVGFLKITARTNSSGFTITSSILTDNGVVYWELQEPA